MTSTPRGIDLDAAGCALEAYRFLAAATDGAGKTGNAATASLRIVPAP